MNASSVSPERWLMIDAVAALGGDAHAVERLGERADLVQLDEDRVGGPARDAAAQALDVGDEEIVADELDVVAERSVRSFQPSQSSSAQPSSIETIGYLRESSS